MTNRCPESCIRLFNQTLRLYIITNKRLVVNTCEGGFVARSAATQDGRLTAASDVIDIRPQYHARVTLHGLIDKIEYKVSIINIQVPHEVKDFNHWFGWHCSVERTICEAIYNHGAIKLLVWRLLT